MPLSFLWIRVLPIFPSVFQTGRAQANYKAFDFGWVNVEPFWYETAC